ncbi:MAG: thiamine pyrophosphate-binding protein [Chloroflexi bacterium]|nr:thiamine pyrophosphate-binding protein [Chloroflexota bacterium]MCI0576945.1 thiamine pyrophosphate-binding protein [Chloroflexota bacterium]MCI0644777.1 thiamine pyrophosphate-binding protein [Chloroflexota bacterium]MCI0729252.1 thiamine pyrophosphate-binding protein [Chloroflexota bacterium]
MTIESKIQNLKSKIVSDVLAEELLAAGVTTVFGLPGGENVAALDALRRHGLRFVLAHHESSAVFMADATARLTRRPAACLTTLGPGATNAVAGVAHAYLDRSPVLVITAQMPERLRPGHTHQFVDLQALFTPITKGSFKLEPAQARETSRAALQLLTHGRPGPVHLQLTNEAAEQSEVDPGDLDKAKQSISNLQSPISNLALAHSLLSTAARPLILAGLGLEPEAPYEALRRLAEAAGAPVITTPKAKGCLSGDHPLAAGTLGLTRHDPAYQLLDEANCLLAVGFDVVELVRPWQQPAPLIWLAPWANVDPRLPAAVEVVGRLQPALAGLAGGPFRRAAGWGQARVARFRQEAAAFTRPPATPGRLWPQDVLQAVRDHTPAETIAVSDVGSHKILAALAWPAAAPNSYLVSNGLSAMGFGLPAAIAAGLALPGRPVVCFTGDGGLAMGLGELNLLARLETPVLVILFNDGALDLIRSQQRRAGKPVFGVEFPNPDFALLAAAYGLPFYRIDSSEACAAAVQAALSAGRPTLIEALIDPAGYPTSRQGLEVN